MQGSHTHIPGTNHVPRGYIVAAILSLLFMVPLCLVSALALLFFYVSIIIIIIIIIIICIRTYNYLLETNHVRRLYIFNAILHLQFMLHIVLFFRVRWFRGSELAFSSRVQTRPKPSDF